MSNFNEVLKRYEQRFKVRPETSQPSPPQSAPRKTLNPDIPRSEYMKGTLNLLVRYLKEARRNQNGQRLIPLEIEFWTDSAQKQLSPQGKIIYRFAELLYELRELHYERINDRQLKGLFVYGPPGTGKTTLLFKLSKFSFEYGYYLTGISRSYRIPFISEQTLFENYRDRCFNKEGSGSISWPKDDIILDDFGASETHIKVFGNEWGLTDFLSERYHLFNHHQSPRRLTFLSTNIASRSELLERYGERMESRISEMMDFVLLNGEDRRKRAQS